MLSCRFNLSSSKSWTNFRFSFVIVSRCHGGAESIIKFTHFAVFIQFERIFVEMETENMKV